MGVTWSIPWALFSAVVGGVSVYLVLPEDVFQLRFVIQAVIRNGVSGAIVGFATGTVFSMALMAAERRGTIVGLRMKRFALWGASAGAVAALGVLIPAWIGEASLGAAGIFLGISTAMGALCATASLRIARAGNSDHRQSLQGKSADVSALRAGA
jgi:hypothetical protein